jgi:hypothetical protein
LAVSKVIESVEKTYSKLLGSFPVLMETISSLKIFKNPGWRLFRFLKSFQEIRTRVLGF